MSNFIWRNMKWRFQNPISIVMTTLQPLLWLVLYSSVAGSTMKEAGVENYTAYILAGIIVLVTFSACGSGGYLNFIMKENGSFYRILIAPVSRSSIVLGQMLEAVLVSFLEVTILVGVSLFLGVRIDIGINLLFMILLIFLTAFFYSGITYTISLSLPNEAIYEMIINAIVLPIFFLSSALFPTENAQGFLAVLIGVNPFTHIINMLRGFILNTQVQIANYFLLLGIMILLCIGSFLLANRSLTKQTMN